MGFSKSRNPARACMHATSFNQLLKTTSNSGLLLTQVVHIQYDKGKLYRKLKFEALRVLNLTACSLMARKSPAAVSPQADFSSV